MSFLQRLKTKDVIPTTAADQKAEQVEEQKQAAQKVVQQSKQVVDQLKVDIFQTAEAIFVYAQIAGAAIDDYSVTIEGENDTVVIKGERQRPNGEHIPATANQSAEQVLAECTWGSFYRQIILPSEVDAEKAEAKSVNGVLVLVLPLQKFTNKGIKLNVTTI